MQSSQRHLLKQEYTLANGAGWRKTLEYDLDNAQGKPVSPRKTPLLYPRHNLRPLQIKNTLPTVCTHKDLHTRVRQRLGFLILHSWQLPREPDPCGPLAPRPSGTN